LKKNKVNMEIRYLAEAKFLKHISKVLMDLFKYRVQLAPEQFATTGFAERKMCLLLDVFDIVKKVRKMSKVDAHLTRQEEGWNHPCD